MSSSKIELGANIGSMVLNRANADVQLRGNLFAGFVFGEQSEDAALGGRQVPEARLLLSERGRPSRPIQQMSGESGTDVILAGADCVDAVDDVGGSAVRE